MEREELQNYWWYRLGDVTKWIIVLLGFFAGASAGRDWFFEEPDGIWIVNGLINAFIWWIVITIIGRLILYVILGKSKKEDEMSKKF